MANTQINSTNRGLISTFRNYYYPSSNSFSGIFGFSTYPQQVPGSSNVLAAGGSKISYYGSGSYLLYFQISSTNPTKGSVSITSPWSETSITTSAIGGNRQLLQSIYGYMTIQANTNYGYTFNGWYTQPSSGTLITTSPSVSLNAGSYQSPWYAIWN